MTHKEAAVRVEKLRQLINDYRYHYHVLNESIMSESAADSLKHELSSLEGQYPDLITPDSPTQRVAGRPLPGFKPVQHQTKMTSLNDVFDETEIKAWQERITKLLPAGTKLDYFVDIKMDGLACSLVYLDGLYAQAVTRGDGVTGEDVTDNIRTISSVPLRLRSNSATAGFSEGRTEIRGEIIMYKHDFNNLNDERRSKGLEPFANPRNLAAGTIRQLDPSLVAKRPLYFRAYDLLVEPLSRVETHEAAYQLLAQLGFMVNKPSFKTGYVAKNIAEITRAIKNWENERLKLPFNTDGLVIKVNNRQIYQRLGIVGKAPRAAIAYKYAAEQSTSKVKDIFVSIGRTGAATPVAILEPVIIAGTTVQMATLHNEGEIRRKDIRVGDTVVVRKAGDIIPEVVEPIKQLRNGRELTFKMPKKCPECQTTLVKSKKDDAVWRCPNTHCPARVQNRIQHFASKAALDIEGMGEKNVLALMSANLIKDPGDIYDLSIADVLGLERFAEISAAKLVSAIQAKKHPVLSRFIYGLGIRHVGAQTAVDLANRFRTLEKLSVATVNELSSVNGVGVVVAESIVTWFAEIANQHLLTKFKKYGVWPTPMAKVGDKLLGKQFVITGTLKEMEREAAAERIRALGGGFQSSVGYETDYLVIGENPGKSKMVKANALGVKQINEIAFMKLIASAG